MYKYILKVAEEANSMMYVPLAHISKWKIMLFTEKEKDEINLHSWYFVWIENDLQHHFKFIGR